MTDAQLVLAADGVLADFNALGVLAAADVHVARRLGALGGEPDEQVLLAAALTVRALRGGSVHLDLGSARADTAVEDLTREAIDALPWPDPGAWRAALAASPLVADGVDGDPSRPLRLLGDTVYLDRYWRQEERIAAVLDAAALREAPPVDPERLEAAVARLFPGDRPDRQRLAAVVAAHRWVSVLAGGPGTGKTTTVAKLLALLQDQAGGGLRVALAAPTAVAATRLTFAARHSAGAFEEQDRARLGTLEASTLHRLLGRRPGSRTRFRHDAENRLPYDVVVVDEASMVSLTLMSRLVAALRPDSRLVLVGDPDQLASVEAGAVLGDLVQRPSPPGAPGALAASAAVVTADVADLDDAERAAADRGVVRLTEVHRFSAEIQELALAVRSGVPEAVLEVLDRGGEHLELVEDLSGGPGVCADVVAAGRALHAAARAGDGEEALRRLARHQVLCGHREGPHGVAHWSAEAERWLREAVPGYAADGRWYVGRPLLVTSNDYLLRLFNGDTGVVVDVGGRPRAAFTRGGVVDLLATSRLTDVQTVHALSVHRSQGSQYDRVTLVLPPVDSPLLTRELLYTGLTRAKEHVRIVGSREAVAAAVRRPIVRASGLRTRRAPATSDPPPTV